MRKNYLSSHLEKMFRKIMENPTNSFKARLDRDLIDESNSDKILSLCRDIFSSSNLFNLFISREFSLYRRELSYALSEMYYTYNIEDANLYHIRLYDQCCSALYLCP